MIHKKYRLFIFGTIAVFLFLLFTEVWDRWSGVVTLYSDLQEKEKLTIDNIQQRRIDLRAQQQLLTAQLAGHSEIYRNNQTGVFEYLNDCARKSGVRFTSLVPSENDAGAQLKEIGFKIEVQSDYHHIAQFVNAIETGVFNARFRKLIIGTDESKDRQLKAQLEGVVYVVQGKE